MTHSRYNVVYPTDQRELEEVYDFFAKSFAPDYFSAKKNFDFLIKNEPYAPLENHLIVKEMNNEIVGAFRIVDRELMFGNLRLKTGGMSYYAVHPKFWHKGVAQTLWKYFLDESDRVRDITIGFGRKVLDGYYDRFGYIGYTSFVILTIELKQLPYDDGQCSIVDFSSIHLPWLKRYYLDNYCQVHCSVYRDDDLWNFNIKKVNWFALGKMYVLRRENDQIIGYFLIKDDTVIEIAGDRQAYPEMAKALKGRFGDKISTLKFSISPRHPFFGYLLQYSHSYNVRRVWNGGHIARLAPTQIFLKKIHPILEERLLEAEFPCFLMKIADQIFDWSGKQLNIYLDNRDTKSDVTFDNKEWQKILLGIVPPSDTIGYNSVSDRATRIMNLLFPVLWPQTPESDHF